MITSLLALAFCLIGIIGGWIASEKYQAYLMMVAAGEHEYEDLFQNNPHPELFDENGNLNRGDYMYIEFPPGFKPEDMKDYYIGEIDEDDEY